MKIVRKCFWGFFLLFFKNILSGSVSPFCLSLYVGYLLVYEFNTALFEGSDMRHSKSETGARKPNRAGFADRFYHIDKD